MAAEIDPIHDAQSIQRTSEILNSGRLWISVEELSVILGVADRTAYEAVRSGEVASFRIGRQYRIPMASIRSLLMLDDG
jgi:excisionase family DNA binding protein